MDQTRQAVHQPTHKSTRGSARGSASPTFAELFTPKLVTVWREGYHLPGASAQIRRTLINHGVKRPLVTYAASISDARTQLAEK
ncbi:MULTISPECIES: hypothetical protein [unclassified Mesorhizobium]|uniref:hypothetical protein n=1 Tax=unclassified Mesorhizobium TaxID=325217 RepID=UPI0015C84769|nr:MULTISPECIES: hypothetical protein [unclassified Mesorhizobium]